MYGKKREVYGIIKEVYGNKSETGGILGQVCGNGADQQLDLKRDIEKGN
ncbi:hypothetical protein L1999_25940 [Neobacillus drentensis]|nr:hypothetical protein [Neobacillus drentensis]ULT56444.1 hypothetical protein L1999_25940 [Neobacillus drentensis]